MTEELFLEALKYGYPAQVAVGDHLSRRGIRVTVPPLQMDRADAGDVLDELGNAFEVQRRHRTWSGRSSFPWPVMLTVQADKIESLARHGVKLRGAFSVSGDLRCAAYANYTLTKDYWFEQLVPHQSAPGTMKAALFCPLDHVHFVPLQDPQLCHCGERGCYSPDGRTWLCPEHSGLGNRSA